MTASAAFIAGDWGTSHLRLTLCDGAGNALETRNGPGAAESRGQFSEVYDQHCADWLASHGELTAVICGMAGSAFGWLQAPYLPCPADLLEIAENLVSPRGNVHIVPGMRCTNPHGAPDMMRGEETQLLGARTLAAPAAGRQLVCMPGTHTKWVSLFNGVVQEFHTAPTGELFSLLCTHSVLVRDPMTPIVHREEEFSRGVVESARHPEVDLLHRLFQCRSLRLDRQLSAEGAASWMSGLLIGTDVRGGLTTFANEDNRVPIQIIGAPQLGQTYALALGRLGRDSCVVDGDQAALAGLACVFRVQQGLPS
jgi:2-dehydro-3-deoxygalactonokinase